MKKATVERKARKGKTAHDTIAVTQELVPLLRRSAHGRIVKVSSSLGSLGGMSDVSQSRPLLLGYCSSKAALSAITLEFANELRDSGIKVNAVCPGLCDTDLSGHRGRPAGEGAVTPIRLALLHDDSPTGGFFNDRGVVPW
jgi:NAD(P)-dependent dehydrogenase (short-subunit alcohol dehydrogenase family)